MFEYIALSALGSCFGGFMTYVILKRAISNEAILQKIDVITQEIMTNEDLQKRVYALGALLGKGAIDGTGLKGRTQGKRGLEGMIMEIVGNYIGSRIGGQQQQQQQPQGVINLSPT